MKEALNFILEAHIGQVRKSEPDKAMIIHLVTVAKILEEYGFDRNVIIAGLLHDTLEDTKTTKEEIKELFGEDICSLVVLATEPDKKLPWEVRKQHTIDTIKNVSLRQKAVVCADKISNLEDLDILFRKFGQKDFSNFKQGFDKQKWYYESVYQSLIYNEDENLPMFKRLKEVLNRIFREESDELAEFFDDKNYYADLKKLHASKQEIRKIQNVLSNFKPFVIELTGSPRTGKTTLINNLCDFFKKGGFKVKLIEEFTSSKYYKEELYPAIKDKPLFALNTIIMEETCKCLKNALLENYDVILIDRSIFDRLVWMKRLIINGRISDEEYGLSIEKYYPILKELINHVVILEADSMTVLKRDYIANLALESRKFLNFKNIDEYNIALKENLEELNEISKTFIDTVNINQQKVSIEVAFNIMAEMRAFYLKEMNKQIEGKTIGGYYEEN